MASTNQPGFPFIDLCRIAVEEAMQNGTIAIRNFPVSQPVTIGNFPAFQNVNVINFPAIQTVGGTVAVNNLTVLQDLVRDKKAAEGTDIITSASATPIITGAKQLRSLMFVNYQTTKLYVQVFGVGANPAVGAVPDLPPFPVSQDQILFLDQATLGVDWLGFPGYTVRVSSLPYSYAPVTGAGIWQMTVRGKA
jgi:hypothetical protein